MEDTALWQQAILNFSLWFSKKHQDNKFTATKISCDQRLRNLMERSMVEHCLEKIYLELEVMKANNGGTLPYGAISKKVEEHKNILTWLDLNKFIII